MQDASLTTEERDQLLSALRELDPEAPPEHRRERRRSVQLNLTICPLGKKSKDVPAILVDVAKHGVGLQTEQPLNVGEKFLLRLRFAEGGGWLVLCGTRNVRPLRLAFTIGAKFLERIEDPDGHASPPLDWLM